MTRLTGGSIRSGYPVEISRAGDYRRAAPALIAVIVAVLAFTGMALRDTVSNDILSAICCCLPLALHFSLSWAKRLAPTKPSPSLVASVLFLVFFGAGFADYLIKQRTISFGVVGTVESHNVLPIVAVCALTTCGYVLGDRVVTRPAFVISSEPRKASTALIAVAQALWLLAVVGIVATVATYHGIAAASDALTVHDRNTGIQNAGSLGSSLWGVFAQPATIAVLTVVVIPTVRPAIRIILLAQGLFLCAAAITIFGGRLLVACALVGLLFAYFLVAHKNIRVITLAIFGILFLVLSVAVLGARGTASNTDSKQDPLAAIGYSIFDVSIASQFAYTELHQQLSSSERLLSGLSTAVPGSGGRSDDISATRIDVLIVQAIGTRVQAQSSGLPPSAPTALWLTYGAAGGFFVALLFGGLSGLFGRWIEQRQSAAAVIFYGLWGAFLFNTFEGGDIFLSIGTEVRRWAYIAIMYFVLSAVTKRSGARDS